MTFSWYARGVATVNGRGVALRTVFVKAERSIVLVRVKEYVGSQAGDRPNGECVWRDRTSSFSRQLTPVSTKLNALIDDPSLLNRPLEHQFKKLIINVPCLVQQRQQTPFRQRLGQLLSCWLQRPQYKMPNRVSSINFSSSHIDIRAKSSLTRWFTANSPGIPAKWTWTM